MEDDDSGGEEPCFAHRLTGGQPVDPAAWRDVERFRKAERVRLCNLRKTMTQEDRKRQSSEVIRGLDALVGDPAGLRVAVYWPIRGELDLRGWMARSDERGAEISLPVVTERGRPVAFHRWRPGCPMSRGVWNIPVPRDAVPVVPAVVIVPLVGIDGDGFRLGNGGGYYDMTLAALNPAPRILAVGQDFCRIASIFPQPWDVRMDLAVLGDGSVLRPPGPAGQDR